MAARGGTRVLIEHSAPMDPPEGADGEVLMVIYSLLIQVIEGLKMGT